MQEPCERMPSVRESMAGAPMGTPSCRHPKVSDPIPAGHPAQGAHGEEDAPSREEDRESDPSEESWRGPESPIHGAGISLFLSSRAREQPLK